MGVYMCGILVLYITTDSGEGVLDGMDGMDGVLVSSLIRLSGWPWRRGKSPLDTRIPNLVNTFGKSHYAGRYGVGYAVQVCP